MWNGVPDPAIVTFSRASTSGVRSGWNDSMRISEHPNCSAVNNQVIPPMWVKGNTRAERSASMIARRWPIPRPTAAIEPSACSAPFGSEVVPDV